jgi:uncharacterized protein (TIGR02757 family)
MDIKIKELLDKKVIQFKVPEFIQSDPIKIPHRYNRREDIEIVAFLTAHLAWGNRTMIIRSAEKMCAILGDSPSDYILNYPAEIIPEFRHRTLGPSDFLFFLESLQNIYRNHGGLEEVFLNGFQHDQTVFSALAHFRKIFMELEPEARSGRHISDVSKGSAAKRLNMFLRWMARSDSSGIDFGLWKSIPASALMIPLDLHTGMAARKLGLLRRKQNDWKAVSELTSILSEMNPSDPVAYDFALFGLSCFEGVR